MLWNLCPVRHIPEHHNTRLPELSTMPCNVQHRRRRDSTVLGSGMGRIFRHITSRPDRLNGVKASTCVRPLLGSTRTIDPWVDRPNETVSRDECRRLCWVSSAPRTNMDCGTPLGHSLHNSTSYGRDGHINVSIWPVLSSQALVVAIIEERATIYMPR